MAEVGSEHCDSDGHDTDLENGDELKGQNTDQIEVLKGIYFISLQSFATCLLGDPFYVEISLEK